MAGPLKLLLASAEVHPYSKTGGLADMVAALAKALAKAGHQVGLVTPLYKGIRQAHPGLRHFDWQLDLPLGNRRVQARVWTAKPRPGLTLYFIDQPEFFQRDGLYTDGRGEYLDNAERFVFLGKCVANLARYLPWQPQLVHVHDWHVGAVPLLLRHQARHEGWAKPPATCLTIHNLAYQGQYASSHYWSTNASWEFFHTAGAEFYGDFNLLKAAIAFSDGITTVSPRYAREITTPEFGCGLDGILRARHSVLTGILNGVDYDEWRTTKNDYLVKPYSARDLQGKAENKLALQKELGLRPSAKVPLFGSVTRLAHQKGLDIALPALETLLDQPLQFALLGSGSREYQVAFESLARRYPGQVAVRIGYDAGLSHRIEAGSDFFLMPSRFEPCGLNQMYSLRYGTLPIVRAVGGLDDSVTDLRDDPLRANGIKFHEYTTGALVKAMRKALALYEAPDLLNHMRRNGMLMDFSWEHTAREYVAVYERILFGA